MELNDLEIYKGKSFSSLCKEIVINQNEKKDQLDILVSELRGLIKTVNDAIVVVPLIKEYLDVGVKNDEQLVKLASIIQRILSRPNDGADAGSPFMMTDEERKQLMEEVEILKKDNHTSIKVKDIK